MRTASCQKATFSSPNAVLLAAFGLRSFWVGFQVGSQATARVARPTPAVGPARSAAVTPQAHAAASFYTVVAAHLVPYTGGPARSSLALLDQREDFKADAPSPMTQPFRYSDSRLRARGGSRQLGRSAPNRGVSGAFGEGSSFFNPSNLLSVRDATGHPTADRVRGSKVQTQPQLAEGSVS